LRRPRAQTFALRGIIVGTNGPRVITGVNSTASACACRKGAFKWAFSCMIGCRSFVLSFSRPPRRFVAAGFANCRRLPLSRRLAMSFLRIPPVRAMIGGGPDRADFDFFPRIP
jgi:hypothetical protein